MTVPKRSEHLRISSAVLSRFCSLPIFPRVDSNHRWQREWLIASRMTHYLGPAKEPSSISNLARFSLYLGGVIWAKWQEIKRREIAELNGFRGDGKTITVWRETCFFVRLQETFFLSNCETDGALEFGNKNKDRQGMECDNHQTITRL